MLALQSVNPESDGRTELGRFAPGKRAGRGNANALRMSRLRATLLSAVDSEKLVKAFSKLQDLAVEGDLAALKLYLAYAVGSPTQAVEISGPEGEPFGGGDLRGLILEALAKHPEARFEVAARLRLARDHNTTTTADDSFDRSI